MKKFLVAIFLISTVLAVDCNYCKVSISEKPYNVYGRKYHKSCFICHHCNEAIKHIHFYYNRTLQPYTEQDHRHGNRKAQKPWRVSDDKLLMP